MPDLQSVRTRSVPIEELVVDAPEVRGLNHPDIRSPEHL
jgi:hypothetical protein